MDRFTGTGTEMSVFGNDPPNMSTEDALRDSLQNLLPPDQRANYMSLFTKFLQQKQQAQKYAATLDTCTEPEAVLPFTIQHELY